MKYNCLPALLLSLLFLSCGGEKTPERVAESFLTDYLECRFPKAARVASSEVVEQMRWWASNLSQADLDLLAANEMPVGVEALESREQGDSCEVVLRAHDCLVADSIGRPGHIGEARYRLTLRKEKGNDWMVVAIMKSEE